MNNKGLGTLVFILGALVLGYWGSQVYAVAVEAEIDASAQAAVTDTIHPMQVSVSGRDISLSGTADSEAELKSIVAKLDEVPGRRVVNSTDVKVLPDVEPYEVALAKAADGSLAATGYVPSEKMQKTLVTAGVPVGDLVLGHGAPDGYEAALEAGTHALAPLDQGSFALTGTTLTLQGVAATPAEAEAARAALGALSGFETVISIDVTDPGEVEFGLDWEAARGLTATGIVPASLGREGLAQALGAGGISGDVGTTYADVIGLTDQLSAVGRLLPELDRAQITGNAHGLTLVGEALPGLDPATVTDEIAAALGPDAVTINAAAPPADGATRINAATGKREEAHAGYWLAVPDFEATKPACTEAAKAAVDATPILFVTASADLDPVSLGVVNDVAGIILHCTEGPGMRVVIGGHTDAEGDDTANYTLSLARARAVREALAARGVPAAKMQPMGYGETEPVASNDTEEGRAQNRRTSFEWP